MDVAAKAMSEALYIVVLLESDPLSDGRHSVVTRSCPSLQRVSDKEYYFLGEVATADGAMRGDVTSRRRTGSDPPFFAVFF
jgi:hypothetical protein